MMKRYFLPLSALYLCTAWAGVDFETASGLRNRMANRVENTRISPVWAPDDSALYLREGEQVVRFDTATGARSIAIGPDTLSAPFRGKIPTLERFAIADGGGFVALASDGERVLTLRVTDGAVEPVAPRNDPFALAPSALSEKTRGGRGKGSTRVVFVNNTDGVHDVEWIDDAKKRKKYATLQPGEFHIQSTYAGHVFEANGLAFTAEKQPAIAYLDAQPPEPTAKRKARNGNARLNDHNLFWKQRGGESFSLTTDGSAERPYRGQTDASPCGRYLLAWRGTVSEKRRIDLIHAAPNEQLQPRTESIEYVKPGDELNRDTPRLFDLERQREIPLDDALFANPWSLGRARWAPDGERLYLLYNERGHQTLRLLAIETATGRVAPLVEETSETFINYSNKTFIHHLDETDELIWMSERDGWNHLYLVDRKSGAIQPITTGEWVVRGVDHVDAEKRQIWFKAMGLHPGQDPYHVHHARVNFDGSGLVALTAADGTHEVTFSPNRAFLAATWSRVDQPPVHELRRASDGKRVAELGRADAQKLLAAHPHLPEPFAAKGRDGETDIHGVIYRPSRFDPRERYPVIEAIYAGPHGQHVPKAFSPYRGPQELAEMGFIVVQIDGMGTNWRSKKFHDVCWKNLKDAGFPDRIAWMKAAARTYPFMDLSRVGVYGGSAGGQNAMRAVLDHADFYKAAAADCGCHDNRMDKIWWNEAWMGWPVDESYAKSSDAVDAHKLGGALLLTVGLLDRNVDPSSTLQVVEALIEADKDFELIPFPNGGHGAGGSEYGRRRRAEFFVRHLIEVAD